MTWNEFKQEIEKQLDTQMRSADDEIAFIDVGAVFPDEVRVLGHGRRISITD